MSYPNAPVAFIVRSVSSQKLRKYYLKVTDQALAHKRVGFTPRVYDTVLQFIQFSSIQFHAMSASV